MKKIMHKLIVTLFALSMLVIASPAEAAGGISASGGGTKTVGQSFTVSVVASGAEFDSLQGVISVSGPVTIAFAAGGATWLPGKSPANNVQFVGITNATSRLTVATITLKGTKEGKGSVSVSSVKLARNGAYVGTGGGSTSFTITRAPTPPGGVEVSSATHPDQNTAYEATTAELTWKPPANGANGYSTAFDQAADTTPGTTITTKDTSTKFENLSIGTHYFHIRANNGDGWGPTTHFKIIIKEPDPKINESLAKPTILSVEKASSFTTDTELGTVSGFTIKGTALAGYVVILSFDPNDRLPKALSDPITTSQTKADESAPTDTVASQAEPKVVTGITITSLMAEPKEDGTWEIPITAAIPAGFYKLTAQSQKEKELTPVSEPVHLELGVANGGTVKFITSADSPQNIKPSESVIVLGAHFRSSRTLMGWLIMIVLLVVATAIGAISLWEARKRRSTKKNDNPLEL